MMPMNPKKNENMELLFGFYMSHKSYQLNSNFKIQEFQFRNVTNYIEVYADDEIAQILNR